MLIRGKRTLLVFAFALQEERKKKKPNCFLHVKKYAIGRPIKEPAMNGSD
jgi:hypothetical protein